MNSRGLAFPPVSLLVLVYNQEALVDRAVASCFAQDCPPIEIVLSDDCSTDDSFARLEVLASGYRGPHTVRVRRNAHNMGIGEHYNQLVAAASGELLITAAGDDVSAPTRVRRLVEAWNANGRRADLIASHVIDLDHEGRLHDAIRVDDLGAYRGIDDWARKRPYIIGAGHAFTRRMMERFGPMAKGIAYEDQIMVFRAIVGGGAITVDEPLVQYRRGGTSGRPSFESAEHMEEWTERQLDRVLAEMQQLIADAELAGHGEVVHALMGMSLKRDRYLRALRRHTDLAELWRDFLGAAPLPTFWRARKVLHVMFPNTTMRTKSFLQLFHRRYWRARLQAKSEPGVGGNSGA